MKKVICSFLLLFAVVFLGTGCWDVQDISNRAFVTAMGFDTVEDTTSLKYRITFEIVNPSGLLRGSNERASIIQTVEAESIRKAMERLQTRIPRLVTLEHLRVVIIGEEMAKQDMKRWIDFFKRHPEVALRMRLMFVHGGEARDILQSKPQMEKNVSEELIAMFQLKSYNFLAHMESFIDFVNELRSNKGRGLASRVLASKEGNPLIYHGGAVFDKWKLKGWLSSNETMAANWITGKDDATVVSKMGQGIYTYQVDKKSVKIIPKHTNGKLEFMVKLKTDGIILEQQEHDLDLTKPKNIENLEKVFSRSIAQEIKAAIYKAQKDFGVDYLGFGNTLNNYDPKTFKTINWEKVFPEVPVEVEVKANITRFGLKH